jgi:type VI secretion system lysozyme-like protein
MSIGNSSSFGVGRVPLFSRFTNKKKVFLADWDEYKKSIYDEVDRILNARSFLSFSSMRKEGRRTVRAYGLADFLHMSPQSRQEAAVLADMIKDTIHAYEPRILVSSVSIELPRPLRGALFAKINAMIRAAECPNKSMTFPIHVGGMSREIQK